MYSLWDNRKSLKVQYICLFSNSGTIMATLEWLDMALLLLNIGNTVDWYIMVGKNLGLIVNYE